LFYWAIHNNVAKKKLRGLSPRANYTGKCLNRNGRLLFIGTFSIVWIKQSMTFQRVTFSHLDMIGKDTYLGEGTLIPRQFKRVL